MGQYIFVAEDAVEGGAADAELAGGAQLVAAVQVEDVLHMMLDDGVEIEAVGAHHGLLHILRGFQAAGQGQVVGADDAVDGFEQGGFEDGGQLTHVAGPVVLQKAGECAGSKGHGALLIADAEPVEQELGQWSNIFAALAQRRNSEADGGQAEREIGKKKSLASHLPQRGLRRGKQDGAAGRIGYYDSTGAIKDFLQNHILQILSLITMDEPKDLTATYIRDEKLKILQKLKKWYD